MTTCPKCGAYIPDGGKMCISCGWKPEKAEGGAFEDVFSKDNPYINYLQQVMDTVVKDFPKDEDRMTHDNSGWTAAASYIGPAFIYTYLKYKDSELVRYHANQACVLFGAEVLSKIFYKNRIPVIGGALKNATNLLFFVLAFMGARAAVANDQKPLPVLGDLNLTILK